MVWKEVARRGRAAVQVRRAFLFHLIPRRVCLYPIGLANSLCFLKLPLFFFFFFFLPIFWLFLFSVSCLRAGHLLSGSLFFLLPLFWLSLDFPSTKRFTRPMFLQLLVDLKLTGRV